MFDSKKREERVHLVLLFFVEHLALTLPYFLLLPPTRLPKRIHRQAGVQQNPTPASPFCLRR